MSEVKAILPPEAYGLVDPRNLDQDALRWNTDARRIGTVAVDQTLYLGAERHVIPLEGYTINAFGRYSDWKAMGVSQPHNPSTYSEAPGDNALSDDLLGINILRGMEQQTVVPSTGSSQPRILVALASFYAVGRNAYVITLEPNPDFDSEVAERVNTEGIDYGYGTQHPFNEWQASTRLEEAGYDPAVFLARALTTAAEVRLPESLSIVAYRQTGVLAIKPNLIIAG